MNIKPSKTSLIWLLSASFLVIGLAACDGTNQYSESVRIPEMPKFEAPHLMAGRSVWMETCRNCHLMGVSGAPAVTDDKAWKARIQKGKETLYQSALTGVKDSGGQFRMPPRGGNARLSDEQVKRAVDYMVSSASHLLPITAIVLSLSDMY